MENYDFVVIGGGSAGYAAAEEASRQGLSTAIVQGSREFGGLCIQRGCMPSKILLEAANRFRETGEAPRFGVHPGKGNFSAREIIARKRRLVGEFADERKKEIEETSCEVLLGRAKFVDPHTLEISPLDGGEGKTRLIGARAVLIATGSYIKVDGIEGLEDAGVLTSDTLLDDEHIPISIVILGAGPVGLEAAHYYRSLGSEVTVVNGAEQILPRADADISESLEKALGERGTRFVCDAKILAVGRTAAGGKSVRYEQEGTERSVEAAEILYAIGRHPCSEGLALEEISVERDERGHVKTLPMQQTPAHPHIFVAGDVAGPYEILHLAVRQGEVAGRNAARHLHGADAEMEKMDYRLKMSAVFTEPEMATVGLSEEEAHEQKEDFHAATYPFEELGRAIVEGETAGLAKLIAERGTNRLLGASLVGPRAAELIHEIAAVMYYRGTADDLLAIPHYHPTLSEIWTSVAEKLVM